MLAEAEGGHGEKSKMADWVKYLLQAQQFLLSIFTYQVSVKDFI